MPLKLPPSLAQLIEAFWFLIDPWIFMAQATWYLPPTVLRLVRAGDWERLTSWPRLQAAWFGTFWAWAGPQVGSTGEKRVVSLLQGRVGGGREREAIVNQPVSGVVLEVGAGSGMWVNAIKNAVPGAADDSVDSTEPDEEAGSGVPGTEAESALRRRGGEKTAGTSEGGRRGPGSRHGAVTKVYGVEPNKDVHAELYRRVKDAGLQGTYEVVPVGIESLDDPTKWPGRIEKESVDCIVTILCLCSIPEPEKNIKALHGFLKKGGRWYVYEHVKAKRNWQVRLYQAFINLFWPHIIGGCVLTRETEKWLREAGSWEKIDLAQPDEPVYHCLPHVYGVLTK